MHAAANHVRDGIAARTAHTNDLDYGPFGVVLKHLKVHHDDSLTSPICKSQKFPNNLYFVNRLKAEADCFGPQRV
ncbi:MULTISPECIES: hypothetical protein [Achromobacter]|uniref:hypothetical protein n=1 Tax=Achromobacter TaxID=222 RepID=UPI001CEDD334|nr:MULTISPECIES: hypothetical protein [Achromobacter]